MSSLNPNELLYLKWKNHYSSLYGSFLQFFSNPLQANYDDATIACDGVFYPVHRFVLSVSSTYFAQMFSAVNKPGRHPIIVLKDISKGTFEILLKFIYLGEVNVKRSKFPEFMNAAKTLQINGLSGYEEMLDGGNAISQTSNNSENSGSHHADSVNKVSTEKGNTIKQKPASTTHHDNEITFKKKFRNDVGNLPGKIGTPPATNNVNKSLGLSYVTSGGVTITPNNSMQSNNSQTELHQSGSTLPVILEYHSLNHSEEAKATQLPHEKQSIVIKTEMPDEYDNDQSNEPVESTESFLPGSENDYYNAAENKYKCSLCPFKSSSKRNFINHMRDHPTTSADKVDDEDLNSQFDSNEDESDNNDGMSMEKPYKRRCTVKKDENDEEFDLTSQKTRTKLEGSITSYNCPLCSFTAPNKHDLSEHGFIHKGGKGFQCADCTYSTIHKHSLVSHRRIHTGEKPYRCLYCDYSSRQKGSILYHQRRRHARSKLFKCSKCQFKSGKKADYEEHVITYHPEGVEPYRCPSCDKSLDTKKDYVKHMEFHLPADKIHRCPICFYSTRNKNVFNLHVLRHKNRRKLKMKADQFTFAGIDEDSFDDLPDIIDGQYNCKFCAFKTPHKGVLTVHIRRHTGEKPYACHMCDYRSAQAGNLDSHLKNHEIKKNFFCPHCSYSAGYEANLERHIKRDHIKVGPPDAVEGTTNDSFFTIENEPGSEDCGEGMTSPMEAMCQVQLDEPNEEMHFSNEILSITPCSSSKVDSVPQITFSIADDQTNNLEGNVNRSSILQIRSFPKKDTTNRNPYVTEVNGIHRCNECFYSTRVKDDMTLHQSHHANEKRCICQYCDYRCIRNQHLTRHVQKFKGGATIDCPNCSYKTCVLNARHRKLCKFFHELYSKNADVHIDNSLALTGIGGLQPDGDSLLSPTSSTGSSSFGLNTSNSVTEESMFVFPDNKLGIKLNSTTDDGDLHESVDLNVHSPIFDPEFDLEVANACNDDSN